MLCAITPYRNDTAPSERFRISAYLKSSFNTELPVRFLHFYEKESHVKHSYLLSIVLGLQRRMMLIFQLFKFKTILLHREAIPLGPPVFEWFMFKILRGNVIYDFDDAIWQPDGNKEFWLKSFLKCRWKYRYIIRNSNAVIAGNSYLQEFAKKYNPNSIIIPTVVDTAKYKPTNFKRKDKPVTIGWTGTSSTMKYLDDVYELVDETCKKHNAVFKIISDKKPAYSSDRFIFSKWNKDTEIEDLEDIDIGIMPLTDDEWTRGKCGFKAIQFMAMEIPVLVSPVGVNLEIVHHGEGGFHCRTAAEWISYLDLLVESPELRYKMGKKSREKIVRCYSLNSTKELFFSLFA
jgi:glycosyltransferase involved in cell wall biosynthesis